MTKCYVDHASNNDIMAFLKTEKGFIVKPEAPPTSKIIPGTLFFVHVHQEKQKKWIAWARNNTNVDVVFMRTDLTQLPKEILPPNCHRCEYPAHKLGEYLQVERFFEELDKGSKDFSLLKRSMFMFLPALIILCQGYLAVHAEHKEQNKDWKDQNISIALEQMDWDSVDNSLIPQNFGKKESTEKVRNPGWWWAAFEDDFKNKDKKSFPAAIQEEWNTSSNKEISKELEDLIRLIVEDNEVKPAKMVAKAYLALVETLGV